MLVMLVLGYSVFESAYVIATAAIDGVEMGFKQGMGLAKNKKMGKMHTVQDALGVKPIALMPEKFGACNDSVYNEKSGTYIPATYAQMVILLPTQTNIWLSLFSQMFLAFSLIPALLAIVLFTKLIVSINKSDIFNWKNVSRLRWIGGSLILNFLCTAIPLFIAGYELSEVFALRGYSLHQADLVSTTTLVLGIASLIVAEVFAIGLKMKEEQDLTI